MANSELDILKGEIDALREQMHAYMEYPEIAKAIDELTKMFDGEGRVLIRPSGTEPLVRVMIEGKNQEQIEIEARKLANLIQDVML